MMDGWIDGCISMTAVSCPACAQLVASSTSESPPPFSLGQAHSPKDSLIIWTWGALRSSKSLGYSRALLIFRKSGSDLIFTEDLHGKKCISQPILSMRTLLHWDVAFPQATKLCPTVHFRWWCNPTLSSLFEPRALLQEFCCRLQAA